MNVTVKLTERKQAFAGADTPKQDDPYLYTVLKDGAAESEAKQQKSSAPSVVFPDVAPGNYTVTVSKFGFEVSKAFSIVAPEVNFMVPDSLEVVVEQPPVVPTP